MLAAESDGTGNSRNGFGSEEPRGRTTKAEA